MKKDQFIKLIFTELDHTEKTFLEISILGNEILKRYPLNPNYFYVCPSLEDAIKEDVSQLIEWLQKGEILGFALNAYE